MMKLSKYGILFTLIALLLASCSDEWQKAIDDGTIPDMTGEQVAFTTNVSSSGSDSRGYTAISDALNGYIAINKAYKLKITMHKQGEEAAIGSCTYEPESLADGQGVLRAVPANGETALYWQDSQQAYGFSVTAGSDNIATDQSDEEKWLAQDRLKGFSYAPVKDDSESPVDNINAINYRTSKQWYQANSVWMPTNGIVPNDDFKNIPLFLQHERAWITVILRAGVGVDRDAVDFGTAGEKIKAEIYNYESDGTAITPWLTEQEVAYSAEDGLPEETRKGVAYHAIVNPYNYLAKAEESIICKINLSGQNFSFYASNDKKYGDYKANNTDPALAEAMGVYNLTAGKHLVIDVTLSRESRKILITAYVEDWTEKVTSSVCDDFGLAGTPIVIQNRDELLAFLSDPTKNKAGQTAIISANSIDLDKDTEGNTDLWSEETKFDLNATLNIGGCTLWTSSQFLNDISASGQILNGTIAVKKDSNVKTVVCNNNYGTISYLDVTADATSTASKAGIAVVNYGNISRCSSAITVEGASGTDFVGGIAAKSIYQNGEIAVEPIIDRCTVTGRVGVASDANTTYGGGIAGLAAGRVTNCTYEYGISLLQEKRKNGDKPLLCNIVNQIQYGKELKANGNEWSTRGDYTVGTTVIKNNRDEALLYDQIIYCQAELNELVKEGSTYNASGKRYRIAQSFTVTSDGEGDAAWPLGYYKDVTNNTVHGNVLFFLEGNGMTITLTGEKVIDKYGPNATGTVKTAPMLFNNIVGTVQNLNVYCENSLYGIPQFADEDKTRNNFTDGCAPFAYAIYKGGKAENITVYGATGTVVQAASAGGIVVSLHDGAQMINCNSFMNVKMYIPATVENNVQSAAKFYSGGIAAMLEDGTTTLTQCRYNGKVDKEIGEASKTSAFFFLGGIVGGLRYSNGSDALKPHATITDCSSWWNPYPAGNQASTGGLQQGSLIGRARYSVQQGSTTNDENGMYDCEGNWWIGTVGAGSWKTGNEALAIGKKNSVTPTKPTPPNQ